MTADAPEPAPEVPTPRKPRKIFLLAGLVVATALGIGLFTSVGTNAKSSGAPHEGGPLPAFSGTDLNASGQSVVSSDGIGHGTPGVVLFFGNWCVACHTELPPLASAVRTQQSRAGALAQVKVIGVDSEDTTASAKGFIHSTGVSFPVAYDPSLNITSGAFYFRGDPNAVFVNADGTINKIVMGDQLTAAGFTADERALIPNGT
jgi:peroxiredoxin